MHYLPKDTLELSAVGEKESVHTSFVRDEIVNAIAISKNTPLTDCETPV